jgi:hypothetical protein
MLIRYLACFLVIFSVSFSTLQSQDHLRLSLMEDSLASIQLQIQKTGIDSVRLSLNTCFRNTLRTAIELPGSFTYPFDSLKKLVKLLSPDKMFRAYNWNLPLAGGANLYFCFLQIPEKSKKNSFTIIELSDHSDSIPDPEHSALNVGCWYGAIYYKIIPERWDSGRIYTLFGWQGKSLIEMQKIIEILYFGENNVPYFGKKIFHNYKDGENNRVIFKYSPVATMILRYEEQSRSKVKNWNDSRRTFEESLAKSPMIVCDRLVTVETSESNVSVMVPAGDVYDRRS